MFSYEEIAEAFEYDPETGIVLRRPYSGPGTRKYPEEHKGARTSYVRFSYKGRFIYAHRIAWMLTYKEWPDGDIGHDDGDGLNNRIGNLKVVTRTENMRNMRRFKNNASGFPGINWDKSQNTWMVRIGVENKRIFLGCFKRLKHAVAARKEAEAKYGYHPNHGR